MPTLRVFRVGQFSSMFFKTVLTLPYLKQPKLLWMVSQKNVTQTVWNIPKCWQNYKDLSDFSQCLVFKAMYCKMYCKMRATLVVNSLHWASPKYWSCFFGYFQLMILTEMVIDCCRDKPIFSLLGHPRWHHWQLIPNWQKKQNWKWKLGST